MIFIGHKMFFGHWCFVRCKTLFNKTLLIIGKKKNEDILKPLQKVESKMVHLFVCFYYN